MTCSLVSLPLLQEREIKVLLRIRDDLRSKIYR
jgi:hypothetical protein